MARSRNRTGGFRAPADKPKPPARNAGISATVPPGTAYVTRPPSTKDSRNSGLNAGIGVAYNAAGQPLGFVQTSVREGVAVQYADGKPTGDFNYVLPGGGLGASLDANRDGVVDPPPAAPAAPAAPAGPTFDFNAPDPTSTMGDAQRRAALQAIVGLNGVGGSAFGGENATANDYGYGFTRYAADVKDAAGNVIHRAGEINNEAGYTAPTSFTSGDTVGGFGNTDPNNPFSRASMLQRSYANANSVSSGSFANRGQLNSGAYQRAQGRNTFGYEQGKDALLKGFAARLGEFQGQRQSAYNAYDSSGLQGSNDLFGRNRDRFDRQYPSS